MHIGSEHPRNLTRQSSSTLIVLTEDDIRSICEKLKSASKDWFNLGLTLGVKFTDLKDIEDKYRNNKRCLTEMVGKRLEVTDPEHPMTWPYICECLRSPTVERNDVAEGIEGKMLICSSNYSVTTVIPTRRIYTQFNLHTVLPATSIIPSWITMHAYACP